MPMRLPVATKESGPPTTPMRLPVATKENAPPTTPMRLPVTTRARRLDRVALPCFFGPLRRGDLMGWMDMLRSDQFRIVSHDDVVVALST